MKHPVHARSLASLVVALCLLAAPAGALAKKGEKNYKRGLEAEKAQQWEEAAQEFALAVAANPSDMEYQLHYRRALFSASQKFMEQGRTLSEQGDYTGAYNAFRRAYGYDPVNELAQAEMARMLRLQREKEEATGRARSARDGQIIRSSFDGANGASGANGNAATPAANTARAAAAARVAEQQSPPTRSEQLRVINYNGDLEGFVRKMAEELEFNVIFDRDFPKRTVNVNLRNVTAARALDHVFIAHNLFFQKLDRRTILVADQSKRGQYQQLVLRTFYLTNIDPNNARTLIQSSLPPNSGRQAIVTPNKETNSITVRDTPENVRLIEELITSIDKERAEVVMDVNIYEVSRTDLLQLGNQVGSSASLGNLGGLNPLQILVGGPNGRGQTVGTGTGGTGGKGDSGKTVLAEATATAASVVATAIGGSFLLPATQLSAFQSKDNTRLLAHTLVHAFDGEQSTTRIGQKVPVQTASVSPFGTAGTGTTTGNTAAANNIFGNSGFPVIQYQDTGLILKFTPQVFPNQDVQVKMEIESNDVIGASTALTPTFSQRSVTGMARIPNNRTMMIASVAQDKQSRGRQGLPLLGLIPIFGRLFSTPTRNDINNDIVITVTPRVLRAAVITPSDIRLKPSGTLQSPVSDTLEAVVREAEREDQLAAARLLPTDVNVQLPAAPAAAETASAQTPAPQAGQQPAPANAQTADAEQPAFIPAPKILAGGDGYVPPIALPVVHVEDVPPPATKSVSPAPGVSAFAPGATALPAPVKTAAATGTAAVAAAAGLPVAAGAELYVVAGGSEMRVGQRQRLMIFVKTGTPLALAAATLKFDPRVLAVRSVTQGSMFGEGPSAPKPSITQSADASGQLLALVAPPAGTHVTGMGVLLFVEVEAIAAGVSAVGFERTGVHLMSADGRGVAAQVSEIRLTVK